MTPRAYFAVVISLCGKFSPRLVQLYTAAEVVFRSRDRGNSWEVISPDLTTNDKSNQGISGGLTPHNVGVEYCCVIYAFDESPAQAGVLWAGSNDGLVHVSRDDGANWTNVRDRVRGLPAEIL